jgi:hypothetical protein
MPSISVVDGKEKITNAKTPERRAYWERAYPDPERLFVIIPMEGAFDLAPIALFLEKYTDDGLERDTIVSVLFTTDNAFAILPDLVIESIAVLKSSLTFNITNYPRSNLGTPRAESAKEESATVSTVEEPESGPEWHNALLLHDVPRSMINELLNRCPSVDVLDPREQLAKPPTAKRKAYLEKITDFDRVRATIEIDAEFDLAFIEGFLAAYAHRQISVMLGFVVYLPGVSAVWRAPDSVTQCLHSLRPAISLYVRADF